MTPGNIVTFSQRYLHGSQIHRRRTRGTIAQIIGGYVFIQVEGAARYSGLVGMPIDKVKVERVREP
jgi:hypothetical protein